MAGIPQRDQKPGGNTLKILLCGLGSIGQRHARLLQRYYPEHAVRALREFSSWAEMDGGGFEVAFITSPTHAHIPQAIEAASRGMHLFIEKPLGCSRKGLKELMDLVKKKNLSTYVAYPLRFHPLIRRMKEAILGKNVLHAREVCASYLPSWREERNHLETYSAHKDQGGGVLLDLSHEIDTAQYLFGEIQDIRGTSGRRSGITVDSEDFADLVLTHPSHVTSVHLNYFSRRPKRHVTVDTDEACFKADLIENTWTTTDNRGTETEKVAYDHDDMYRDQLTYFFDNLANKRMDNNLFDAEPLFEKLITFREGT